jgi:aspartate/methionine/tyrosine aminotransferase
VLPGASFAEKDGTYANTERRVQLAHKAIEPPGEARADWEILVELSNRIGLPTFEPKGAFYAFPKVSVTGLSDETFATRLLEEEHVAIVPGNSFGAGGDGFCRCSYATAYDKLEEALRRIERFVNRL